MLFSPQLIVFIGILNQQSTAPAGCDTQLAQCRAQLVKGYHLRARLCLDDFFQRCDRRADQADLALATELRSLAHQLSQRSPRRVLDARGKANNDNNDNNDTGETSRQRGAQQSRSGQGRRPVGHGGKTRAALIDSEPFVICAEPLLKGHEDQAAQCFEQLGSISTLAARRQLATALARLSRDMYQARLAQLADPEAELRRIVQRGDDDKLRYVLRLGRSGLFVGSAALYGGFVGLHLGDAQRDLTHLGAGLGAAAGMGLALAALTLHSGLKAQDLTLISSGLFMGGLNGLLLDARYSPGLYLGSDLQAGALLGLSASLLPATLSLGATYLFDLPEGGVRLATSLATWSAGLYFLARLSFPDDLRLLPPKIMPMGLGMAISADLVYLGALALSPLNPIALDAVWAIDLGVTSGALAAYGLGNAAGLANTRLHTATIAAAMILGGISGYALRHIFVKKFIDAKLRGVEPLMLVIQAPRDALLAPADDSSQVNAAQMSSAQGLAFGLRWRSDLTALLAPAR